MAFVPFSKSSYTFSKISPGFKGRIGLCGDQYPGQRIADEGTQMFGKGPESVVIALQVMRIFSHEDNEAAYFEAMNEA